MSHVLIIDDQQDSAEMMAKLIAAEGFSVATAGSLGAARRQMALQRPDLVFLELVLPDGAGMRLADEIKALPDTRIVLIAPCTDTDTAASALRMGAVSQVTKPINLEDFRSVLSSLKQPPAWQADDVSRLDETVRQNGHFGLLWGRSQMMLPVYAQILRVATTSVTVFVTGESGSGKELAARMVHELSRRRTRPFLAVNCGAISPHLIESEIFGHEKGSFTGAERQHQGFFERASGGTLFLDEITEMPLDLQVKLLRVLETGTFMRVGSAQTQETDVRIIAASNQNPVQAAASGRLREDLLYRLNVFPIHLPALRERPQDIPLLVRHFLDDIGRREGQVKHFSPEALARLTHYHWPGNARELRNVVHRAYVMATGETILNECLPTLSAIDAPFTCSQGAPRITIELGMPLAEVERLFTLATLEHFGRHKERTAAALGVSLKTLYNRLKEYSSLCPSLHGDRRNSGIRALH